LEALEPWEKEDSLDSADQLDHLDLSANVVNQDHWGQLDRQASKDHEAMMELLDWTDNQVHLDKSVIQVDTAHQVEAGM